MKFYLSMTIMILILSVVNLSGFKTKTRSTLLLPQNIKATALQEGPDPAKDNLKNFILAGSAALFFGWQSSQFASIEKMQSSQFASIEKTLSNLQLASITQEKSL